MVWSDRPIFLWGSVMQVGLGIPGTIRLGRIMGCGLVVDEYMYSIPSGLLQQLGCNWYSRADSLLKWVTIRALKGSSLDIFSFTLHYSYLISTGIFRLTWYLSFRYMSPFWPSLCLRVTGTPSHIFPMDDPLIGLFSFHGSLLISFLFVLSDVMTWSVIWLYLPPDHVINFGHWHLFMHLPYLVLVSCLHLNGTISLAPIRFSGSPWLLYVCVINNLELI